MPIARAEEDPKSNRERKTTTQNYLSNNSKKSIDVLQIITAIATGVGLIPLALGVGEPGKEIQQPMAVVILGGIFTSTFLNMIVIPALFSKFGENK